MKRECLEYANLPDKSVKELSPAEDLIASIAWMGDNEGYGIQEAARKTIDKVRALSSLSAADEALERAAKVCDANAEHAFELPHYAHAHRVDALSIRALRSKPAEGGAE